MIKVNQYCCRERGRLRYRAFIPDLKNSITNEVKSIKVECSSPKDLREIIIATLRQFNIKESQLFYYGPIKPEYLEENQRLKEGILKVE